MSRSNRSAGERWGDVGTTLVGASAAVLALSALVLFATNVIAELYATTAVTSAALDAAQRVAATPSNLDPVTFTAATDEASARLRSQLGGFGADVRLDWSGSDDSTIVLRVSAPAPGAGKSLLGSVLGPRDVDRTVRVRREVWR